MKFKLIVSTLISIFVLAQMSSENLRKSSSHFKFDFKDSKLMDMAKRFNNGTTPEEICINSNGTAFTSHASFDSHIGTVDGLETRFCLVEDSYYHSGMIDLQTLTSAKPSIGATYLIQGIDLEKLPVPSNISQVCKYMQGTSIGYYTNGGYTNKYGIDEICVFPDGSKISSWTLMYISQNPQFLNIRANVQSQALPIDLPYISYNNKNNLV